MIHSIDYAPRWNSLPSVVPLIDDAGGVKMAAKYLDLNDRTVAGYYRLNQAPRSVCWALFWISRWGRGLIEVNAQNDARQSYALMCTFQSENRRLKEQLQQLEAMLRERPGEASNDPIAVYGGRR